jgi:hypothetical protein
VNALDLFAASKQLNIRGRETYATKVGALFSIFTIGMSIAYAVNKINVLWNRLDPTIS